LSVWKLQRTRVCGRLRFHQRTRRHRIIALTTRESGECRLQFNEKDLPRISAFLTVFIGFPLLVNAQCISGYTQLPNVTVCQQNVRGSDPACASGYGPVSNAFVCQPNADGTTMTINDTDSSVIYSTVGDEGTGPTWFIGSTAISTPKDYMNDEHYSNFSTAPAFDVNGDDSVVNFMGTGITWIGKIGPNFGIAYYSVDGGEPVAFDGYNPTLVSQNNSVVISGLASGSHSLKIEVTHNKNPSSSDYYQVIDAFNITGSPLTLDQGAVAGYNSPELSFSGPWTCGADPNGADLSGGHCYSNAKNASISWTFTGSLIAVYGRPNLENGIFNVLIDGTQVDQIDGHFGTADIDELNGYGFFQAKVGSGTHTIQLVNTGTLDSAATNTFMQIDMFVALP